MDSDTYIGKAAHEKKTNHSKLLRLNMAGLILHPLRVVIKKMRDIVNPYDAPTSKRIFSINGLSLSSFLRDRGPHLTNH